MTRVLLVHQPIDGGVARHVGDLFDGLLAAGHEPVLCGPAIPAASAEAAAGRADASRVRLPLRRAVAPGSDLKAVGRFARIVRAVKPDVIHAHSSKAGAVARAARLADPRVPVVYTPHGYAFAGFFEHELERSVYRNVERVLGLLTSRVLAVCDAEARLAARVTGPARVRVVHNGIEPPPRGPSDPGAEALRARGPLICAVTQLRPGKGVETLLDALPTVLTEHPRAQLALVGDGSLREALQGRSRALGIAEAVHFLGERADPLTVLRAGDVFAFPSWAEAFPYAILEAMSLGLPIVASNVGGIPEALTDRTSGRLVPARDPGALGAALAGLLADPPVARRLGQAAALRLRTCFSRRTMVDGVLGVYDELLR